MAVSSPASSSTAQISAKERILEFHDPDLPAGDSEASAKYAIESHILRF